MGFFRQQEEKLAIIPDDAELARQATRIVEEAHKIARERGSNVMSIMKELIADLKQKK
jgi:hypothetical protein